MSISTRLFRHVTPLLFNGQRKQRLSILIYHRVVPERDPMRPGEPTAREFDSQIRILSRYFTPLSLVEAVERLRSGTLPGNAVCVTFDDGYADNESQAMPVLLKYGVPATVFVSTGFLNGGRMWNDTVIEVVRNFSGKALDLRELDLAAYPLETTEQRLLAVDNILREIKHLDPGKRITLAREIEKLGGKPLRENLMMTDVQIQSLARNGITIGAHTINHPILSSIPIDHARKEIEGSRQYLESVLQKEVEVFAYPNGRPDLDYGKEHRDLVSELGFRAAVSTHWGVGTCESDVYQLPRFTPWDRHPARFAMRLLANYRKIDPLVGVSG